MMRLESVERYDSGENENGFVVVFVCLLLLFAVVRC
jgi:hypothetical protein